MSPLLRLAAIVGYLAALLLVDTRAGLPGQLALGVLTWLVLGWLLLRETPLVRAQTTTSVCARTSAVSGSSTHASAAHVSAPSASCPSSATCVSTSRSAARYATIPPQRASGLTA